MYKKTRRGTELLREFGEFLKTKREAAKLSQSEVAKNLGYSSPQFISNFERGLCAPPLAALKRIAEVYKISRKELIGMMMAQQRQYLEAFFADSARRNAESLKGLSRRKILHTTQTSKRSVRRARLLQDD